MPIITCRDIGNIGRLGNQLFLYCHARGYAEAMGCDFQCGDWIGRKIFVGPEKDPMVTVRLPQTVMDSARPDKLGYYFGQKDIDVKCYGMHQVFIDFYTRAKAKGWLKIKPELLNPNPLVYSVAHMRRGDYLLPPFNKLYAAVTDKSYTTAIEKFNIPKPVQVVQEGWMQPPELYKQIGAPWLWDFMILMDALYLLRANSSFSQWAGWLGNGTVWSPVVGNKVGWQDVPFVEGNHPNTAGIFRNQSSLYLKES